MATLTLGTAGNYTWYLDYTTTQSVVNNQSTIAYTLRIHRNVAASSGAFWGTPARSFNVTLNGVSDTENFSSIDFRAAADIDFTSGSVVINHNADGTKSPVSVSAAVTGSYVSAGFPVPTTLSGLTISLATIPRAATSITRSSGTETGSASVLAISPLVSSFYYVLKYKSPLTGSWTAIGPSGGIVGTSWPYSNTVAHGEIPDAGSGTVQYQVTTLDASGGSQIGTPVEASFTYTVPSSVLPTAGAPTWAEGATDTGLSTLTNAGEVFCQAWSKLVPSFSATPGTGATVSSATASVAGVSGTTTSGVAFSNRVSTQGVGATFTISVTDSRGRNDTETGSVSPSVHRWSLPTANAGTPVVTPTSSTQTIALSGLSATTTSFFLSASQRNVLETRVGYRDLTTAGAWVYGSWTAQSLSGSDSTDNAYAPGSPLTVATGLDPTHEYEVTLQVRDIFGKNAVNYSNGLAYVESSFLVAAQNVLIAFDGNTRVGIKKVPVNGALDVAGDVYADELYAGGNRVVNVTDAATDAAAGITEYSTDAEAITGTATDRAMTPASAKAALNDASNGYRLYDVVEYTASGSFTKASYPGLRAVRVRVQGGGGAGGGAAAPSGTQHSAGSGGGGGGYAERFLLAASLGTSETVTVGAGGTGVSAGTGNSGGSSSFGSLVVATGGTGGAVAAASNLATSAAAGAGGAGTTGDFLTTGSGGAMAGGNATLGIGGSGGASALGGGGAGGYTPAGSSGATGTAGGNYGGGGGGSSSNASASARAGGNGAGGAVIVEVFV